MSGRSSSTSRSPPRRSSAGAGWCASRAARQWLAFHRSEATAAALAAAVAQQAPIVDLSMEEPDIEDVIRRIYTEGRSSSFE